MNHKCYLILVTLFLISCSKKESDKNLPIESKKEACAKEEKPQKEFKMYEMSEMAALMEQMYVDNERLKQRIIKGDTIGKFPQHFLKIHKAVMTDEQENDDFFKAQAGKFINAQQLIYKDPKNAKQHFNNSIDACIRCHEQKCGGPIPRIKKLYIK